MHDAHSVDTLALTTSIAHDGALWSTATEQLNVNVLRFRHAEGVPLHLNNEVDVVVVVLSGAGTLTIDDQQHVMQPGRLYVIPRGVQRSIICTAEELVYITCHQRRRLMPM